MRRKSVSRNPPKAFWARCWAMAENRRGLFRDTGGCLFSQRLLSLHFQTRPCSQEKDTCPIPKEGKEHEEKGFVSKPRDWIDGFSRHFRPSRHTHLRGETVAEMLPWLKLSAELDPHRIQPRPSAYWFREGLGKSA